MGAMMNEAFQAKAGLEPDLFPDDIPTYTGHYHKPHTVADTNITYIGSPYQGKSPFCVNYKPQTLNTQPVSKCPLTILTMLDPCAMHDTPSYSSAC